LGGKNTLCHSRYLGGNCAICSVAKILEDVGRVMAILSKKPANIQSIVVTTRLHKRTVKRYLELIEIIQNAPKLKREIKGARVLFRMDS